MRVCVPYLAAAFCASMLALLSPMKAEASQYAAFAQAISASQPQAATLQQVGYYGGGDYYGDDQKDDYGYSQKPDYYGGGHDKDGYGGGYRKDGYGGGYGGGGYGGHKYGYGDNGGDYGYHRKQYDDYPDGCCNNGCYKKKWVCEESEPRCRKARECVWYYGKEYCRYVRRCHGGGDRYCKWVSVRSYHCGY